MTKPRSHYWLSALFGLLLIPALRSQHLPLKFAWLSLGIAYWIILAAQSIFLAALLALIGLRRESLSPLLARYRGNPVRIPLLLIYFLILAFTTNWLKAITLTVDTVALLELIERNVERNILREVDRNNARRFQPFLAVLAPASYLFFGFLMVLAYNSAIVSARFNFATDPALFAIDRWLLFGHTVPGLAHWAVQTFPLGFFQVLEFIYFGMFPQIGAAIIILALCDNQAEALRFVGTILTAYYLALVLFYLWPAQGPYYLCPEHFSRFPASLQTYSIQKALIAHALARWRHEPISRISTDYFIALPCMHIAQPLIVMWFLRRWRRIVLALVAYDLLLLAAIVLLEWHYVTDIVAGVLVAAAAVVVTGGVAFGRAFRMNPEPTGAPK